MDLAPAEPEQIDLEDAVAEAAPEPVAAYEEECRREAELRQKMFELKEQGFSQRDIAEALEVDRGIVRRYFDSLKPAGHAGGPKWKSSQTTHPEDVPEPTADADDLEQVEMFDITVFDDETVEYLRESEGYINERRRLAGTAIVEIGQRLVDVRDWLEEDEGFLAWIASAFEWKKSTAYNFRNVATAFPNFGGDLALIEPSALYLISAPKAPEPARDAVKETAAEGQKVSHTQAKAAVGAAKQAERRAAALAWARCRERGAQAWRRLPKMNAAAARTAMTAITPQVAVRNTLDALARNRSRANPGGTCEAWAPSHRKKPPRPATARAISVSRRLNMRCSDDD